LTLTVPKHRGRLVVLVLVVGRRSTKTEEPRDRRRLPPSLGSFLHRVQSSPQSRHQLPSLPLRSSPLPRRFRRRRKIAAAPLASTCLPSRARPSPPEAGHDRLVPSRTGKQLSSLSSPARRLTIGDLERPQIRHGAAAVLLDYL
jgi:hypothetical protein